ncbi:hypothetical protein AGABI2DRAFT_113960 [Agaricus bisporus var. bisporus H97]|uniref:hypothetical protein n=1 Tax=Agaricus bisporus var. bisporus (strain H97 / ATCC MYA-4626 / FGSC 10389) TaxID=936046 RepID=UPI00029F51EB|nr:hypothetical protein AGABI2DRAFT_113960 [Agaricus bisporus var. bisporus H97]EKV51223.1 hypothetical protein AGABI2DRAFT_113960 [Agaricus bisporus var. bisporus H97]
MLRRRNLNREDPVSRSTFIPRTKIHDGDPTSPSQQSVWLSSVLRMIVINSIMQFFRNGLVSLAICLALVIILRDCMVSACGLYSFHRPSSSTPPICSYLFHLSIGPQLNELKYRIPMIESRLSYLERNISYGTIIPSTNYASAANGAQVVLQLTTPPRIRGWRAAIRKRLTRSPRSSGMKSPNSVLSEGFGAGDCWEFTGSRGHLGISLSQTTPISAFSLDYPRPDSALATSVGKSPRSVVLWALLPSDKLSQELSRPVSHFLHAASLPPNAHATDRFIALFNGTFNPTLLPTRQYFPLTLPTGATTQTVVMEVLSNWGSSSTCVYYVGVH